MESQHILPVLLFSEDGQVVLRDRFSSIAEGRKASAPLLWFMRDTPIRFAACQRGSPQARTAQDAFKQDPLACRHKGDISTAIHAVVYRTREGTGDGRDLRGRSRSPAKMMRRK